MSVEPGGEDGDDVEGLTVMDEGSSSSPGQAMALSTTTHFPDETKSKLRPPIPSQNGRSWLISASTRG